MPRRSPRVVRESDPLWYKDAIIYQVHVRAFFDSNNDGRGDFRGLTSKLDYLSDLGVTALWLLPFYPSPLRDDGYDIADYNAIHTDYGTLRDFKDFLGAAHDRGLRVITELVVNHTSDQHPWFQRARRSAPGSRWRDYYVWSDTPERYREARIIFKDFEGSNWTWDPIAKAYFWHRFYHHQPDLNFDNPRVQDAILKAMEFWLEMGVDGLRLDAVPYLYERDGTNCENLPETHAFLKHLRAHLDARFADKMLLAEANQWPEDAREYFGDGDECHMAFHFPVMPRLFMALHQEDRFPIVDILEQTPPIPEISQWAMFLRNHDELTLEMVTDEERDYMYRVYARDPRARVNLGIRRRLAPLLDNNRRKIEMLNGLLFALPGTPIIYYGDELGMGDNYFLGDRNGVRTPMHWSPDRNAGFSRTNPQQLYLPPIIDPEYHYEALNVESQQQNLSSLLWWMKRLIAMRKRHAAFGRGTLELLHPDNGKIMAFVRSWEGETILVVANLSRFTQPVVLDLSQWRGCVPIELFGSTEFPQITDASYPLTLGPHTFYWFALEVPEHLEITSAARRSRPLPAITLTGPWSTVLTGSARAELERLLPDYVRARRWFGGKARKMKGLSITDVIPMESKSAPAWLVLVTVTYVEGELETYLLPLTVAEGPRFSELCERNPHAAVARLVRGEQEALLHDAAVDASFSSSLLDAIARRRRFRGAHGEIAAQPFKTFRKLHPGGQPEPSTVRAEQSNTSIIYGQSFILKLFRKIDAGLNPDLELSRFLGTRGFEHTPALAGVLEYRTSTGEPSTLGLLQAYVPNEGDAWDHTRDGMGRFFDRILALPADERQLPPEHGNPLRLLDAEPPQALIEMVPTQLDGAWLLGQRTAQLHRALASEPADPAFAPEPLSTLWQRSVYQGMRTLTGRVFATLKRRLHTVPEAAREEAETVLGARDRVLLGFGGLLEHRIDGQRIRTHGDYHLGQVLFTGRDYVIIDFEGEPARPLSERRIKRSPLRDIAGMLRSYHYASHGALLAFEEQGLVRPEDRVVLEPWAAVWYSWMASNFLRSYLAELGETGLVPQNRDDLQALLRAYLLEKAVYELGYELGNRPEWVRIPLRGILELVDGAGR